MTTFNLRPLPLPLTQQVDDIAFVFKKVGSQGHCLLSLTFGKVEIEGIIFDFGFRKSLTFDIEIDNVGVEGSIFENDPPFTRGGGGGAWGAGEGPIWDKYVTS
jgi:hypothetical protein